MSSTNGQARQPQRLSVSATADVLGVSRWTVRRMVEAGELDAIEVHGMLRVESESIERYVAEHRHNGRS